MEDRELARYIFLVVLAVAVFGLFMTGSFDNITAAITKTSKISDIDKAVSTVSPSYLTSSKYLRDNFEECKKAFPAKEKFRQFLNAAAQARYDEALLINIEYIKHLRCTTPNDIAIEMKDLQGIYNIMAPSCKGGNDGSCRGFLAMLSLMVPVSEAQSDTWKNIDLPLTIWAENKVPDFSVKYGLFGYDLYHNQIVNVKFMSLGNKPLSAQVFAAYILSNQQRVYNSCYTFYDALMYPKCVADVISSYTNKVPMSVEQQTVENQIKEIADSREQKIMTEKGREESLASKARAAISGGGARAAGQAPGTTTGGMPTANIQGGFFPNNVAGCALEKQIGMTKGGSAAALSACLPKVEPGAAVHRTLQGRMSADGILDKGCLIGNIEMQIVEEMAEETRLRAQAFVEVAFAGDLMSDQAYNLAVDKTMTTMIFTLAGTEFGSDYALNTADKIAQSFLTSGNSELQAAAQVFHDASEEEQATLAVQSEAIGNQLAKDKEKDKEEKKAQKDTGTETPGKAGTPGAGGEGCESAYGMMFARNYDCMQIAGTSSGTSVRGIVSGRSTRPIAESGGSHPVTTSPRGPDIGPEQVQVSGEIFGCDQFNIASFSRLNIDCGRDSNILYGTIFGGQVQSGCNERGPPRQLDVSRVYTNLVSDPMPPWFRQSAYDSINNRISPRSQQQQQVVPQSQKSQIRAIAPLVQRS